MPLKKRIKYKIYIYKRFQSFYGRQIEDLRYQR